MVTTTNKIKLDNLQTETRNQRTMHLDEMSIHEVAKIMNQEDQECALAVRKELVIIEKAIAKVIETFREGGRLIYIGAGTSGRLGILDAVECVPTFSTTDEVTGIIAGGNQAFIKAVEGAEDKEELGVSDLKELSLTSKDTVFGIAASGRTPYVVGALTYANELGAMTISLSCNKDSIISKHSQLAIEVDAGPEILTGSTRLKAGTCQKLVLNMISTISMVGIGKVYGNLMVDVKATNKKLVERSRQMIVTATGCTYEQAKRKLEEAKGSVKLAIVMLLSETDIKQAEERLIMSNGFVSKAIKN